MGITSAQEAVSVSSALKNKQNDQSLFVEAIITKVYRCPPCPQGAQCKPCDDEHIILKDPISADVIKAYVFYGSTFYQNAQEGKKVKAHVLWRAIHSDGTGEYYHLPAAYPGKAYYSELEKKCQGKESENCCKSSFERLRQRGVREAPSSGCPEGTNKDMLKCKDSLKWCY